MENGNDSLSKVSGGLRLNFSVQFGLSEALLVDINEDIMKT